eukprot:TRINITY_DN40369_c0_g1_i2.p1 TRINITY_DN40369_c0_g1~~TRINITY_DN40369_c0_g1_i2.p1  ORF type:complete len:465 (+),score=70.19 TRINITY_DN40369_c0_g1_i2:76-1395(+)
MATGDRRHREAEGGQTRSSDAAGGQQRLVRTAFRRADGAAAANAVAAAGDHAPRRRRARSGSGTPERAKRRRSGAGSRGAAGAGKKMRDIMLAEMRQRPQREPPPPAGPGAADADAGGGAGAAPQRRGALGVAADGGESTNIAIDGLDHRTINEASLVRTFGEHGAIASVKIMWPRTDQERARVFTKAYVNFMDIEDARRAFEALHGTALCGCRMRLSWGRSMSKPAIPLYVPPTRPHEVARTLARLGGSGACRHVPADLPPETRRVVDSLAVGVARHGAMFENAVKCREGDNPHFQFLFATSGTDAVHCYYRWRVYSLLQGDSVTSWRTEPFQMVMGGELWVPPHPAEDGGMREGAGLVSRADALSEQERAEFFAMLRGLVPTRQSVADAMVWAIDRAAASNDIVDIVTEALSLPETPPRSKVARLCRIRGCCWAVAG